MNQESRPSRPATQPGYAHIPESTMTPGERRQRQISNLRTLLYMPHGPEGLYPPPQWSHSFDLERRQIYSLCLLIRAEQRRSPLEPRATEKSTRQPLSNKSS